MADDAKLYRERAAAERLAAEMADLANVRARCLHAADRWDELAVRAEHAAAGAAQRAGRMTTGGALLPRSGLIERPASARLWRAKG